MRPKIQQPLNFNNKCNCIVDYELLEKAMLWYSGGTLKSDKVIYMHGSYPAVSIYHEKIHVHRLLAIYKNKSAIAKEIHAHHKDGDKLNASIDNIELVHGALHLSQHNKGRVLSKEHKAKIAEAGKKRVGIKLKRKYIIPDEDLSNFLKEGWSIRKIAIHYGCDWSVVKQRINEMGNSIYQNPELLTPQNQ